MHHSTTKLLVTNAGVSFTASLGAFVKEGLTQIGIWLLVIFMVIIVDLLMSIYKIIKVRDRKMLLGIKLEACDHVRWSKGLRDTMAKVATYFAFVVAMVFISNASHITSLDTYGCMAVIFGESLSIIGNWCKAHGYEFDFTKFFGWGAKKVGMPAGMIRPASIDKTLNAPKHSKKKKKEELS